MSPGSLAWGGCGCWTGARAGAGALCLGAAVVAGSIFDPAPWSLLTCRSFMSEPLKTMKSKISSDGLISGSGYFLKEERKGGVASSRHGQRKTMARAQSQQRATKKPKANNLRREAGEVSARGPAHPDATAWGTTRGPREGPPSAGRAGQREDSERQPTYRPSVPKLFTSFSASVLSCVSMV